MILVWHAAALLSGAATLWLGGRGHAGWALAVHGLAAGLAAAAALAAGRPNRAGLAGALALAAPGAGPALALALVHAGGPRAGVLDAYREHVSPVGEPSRLRPLPGHGPAAVSAVLSAEPLVHALGTSDPELKRRAILRLGELGTPRAVRILRRALKDGDGDLRLYAYGALSRIGERLAARVDATGDGAGGSRAIEHARALLDLAESGLVEPPIAATYAERARETLAAARISGPAAAFEAGRAALRAGDPGGARAQLEPLVGSPVAPARSRVLLAEACHAAGDLDALRRWAADAVAPEDDEDPLAAWAGRA